MDQLLLWNEDMDTGPNIMDKYGYVSMTEDRSIIDKNA